MDTFFTPKAKFNNSQFAETLKKNIRGDVLFDSFSRGRYSTDASIYQVEPKGVIIPKTEEDVLAAIQISRENNIPILPRGAGTSQCGQTVGESLVIDTSKHLKKIVRFIENSGKIEILAIGIGHDVSRYYQKAIKITDVQELGDVMISQLSGLFDNKKKLN